MSVTLSAVSVCGRSKAERCEREETSERETASDEKEAAGRREGRA